MASFTSRRQEESKLYPGCTFTINKINEGRRRSLRLSLANINSKIRALIGKRLRVEEEIAALQKAESPVSIDLMEQRQVIIEQLEDIQSMEVNPAWMKFGLAGIEGFEVDGVASTPETVDDVPSDLYYEILNQIQRELGLTEDEGKNSQSPSISTESEDGKATLTTVTTVSDENATASVIAESIPPQLS